MTKTPQQFDGLTIEEREAYLERRDRAEREQAIGRALSAESSTAHHEFWIMEARAMLKREPKLIFDIGGLSDRVSKYCNDIRLAKPKGGGLYKRRTIYNYLTEHRSRLLDESVPGKIPAIA